MSKIRYGVIPCNLVADIWDSLEPAYALICEKCRSDTDGGDCMYCGHVNNFDEDETGCWQYASDRYILTTDSDCIDLFVIKSPYYTFAQFCSPCAPGACYLPNHITPEKPINNKCYCLGAEWFDIKPNYTIYRL